MPRVLIVYYSRTGHTARVAAQLATALQADIEPIVEPTRRTGLLGAIRSGYHGLFRRATPIATPAFDPAAYELVLIGTPVWDMSLASPVRSYLRRYRSLFPRVAFFCTCGGVGVERVFRQMSGECGRAPIATMALTEGELKTTAVPIAIARFIVHIRAAQGPQRRWETRNLGEAGRTRLGA